MLVKYIDSNYIIENLQKPSWGEVEEPDFYITMASNRVKALIFPSEQGDPNNLASYTSEQQEAIKLATAIYTLWYFDTNYDFTNGSVSVNFGGVSMSESKTYNGEMVLPNVFDILKQANLIPTTETFIFNNVAGSFDNVNINPKAFKDLQQEMERQTDNNIRQDLEIVKINDRFSRIPSNEEQEAVKKEVAAIKEEQIIQNQNIQANRTSLIQIEKIDEAQNTAIETNLNNINTIKTDLGDLGNQVIDVQNKTNANTTKIQQNTTNITTNTTNIQNNTNNIQTNTTNITALDGRLVSVSSLLNDTINGLKTLKPFQYVGEYQAGTTYRINQAVSLNNNLYLSKEDNNTTTPPGNKWLLLNEDFATIDLTQYYTKLEVNAIRDNLQNSINTNATNITTIRNNYLDKTSTSNNIIAGNSTYFTHSVYVNQPYNPNQTPNYDFLVNGNSSLDNAIFNGNVEFTNSPTVPTPTADNHAVNKGFVNSLISNLSGVVKTTGDQTISGTKSFNAPLNFPNRRMTTTTFDNITVAHINAQTQKFMKFDFEQTAGGFQNYSWLQMNAKFLNSAWQEIFSIGFKNQDVEANRGVWMNCSNNRFSFGHPTKVSNVATPTNNNDAANKEYVDSRTTTLPNWERVYSVSNFNPIDGVTINYLFMNDYEYLIYIDTFNTALKGQAQIRYLPNLKGTNDETGDDDYITRMFLAHTGQNGKSWNTDFFTIGIFRRQQIRFLPNERNYNALNSVKINVKIYRRPQ